MATNSNTHAPSEPSLGNGYFAKQMLKLFEMMPKSQQKILSPAFEWTLEQARTIAAKQEPADDEDYQKLIHTQSDLEHSRAFAKDLSCQIDKLKRELSETKLLLARFKKQELVNIKYLNAVKEVVRISDRDHIAWDTVKEFIFCAEQNVGGALIDELTESIIIICDFEDAIAHYAKTKDEAWRNGDGAQIMAVYQASTERGKKMVAEMFKTPKDQKGAE